MNSNELDRWLTGADTVALILEEELEPVLGKGAVVFPPTFAPPEGSDDKPSYLIDELTDHTKVALIDTIGSQANRMEPVFQQEPYRTLVPKVTIHIGDRKVDLLEVGHRAADAVVRFSNRWASLREAFLEIREKADATKLAKLAPTSLVFGVWDSRDTQVKLPRLIGSTVRAYNVEKLTRSAQFFASTEKEEVADLASSDFLSGVGLNDAPAGRTAGGVIANGGIRRQAVLNLIALRALRGSTPDGTKSLQRYILGLALVALLTRFEKFLREGCLLVSAAPGKLQLVLRSGEHEPVSMDEQSALSYAETAAAEFGVGESWEASFSKEDVSKAAAAKSEKAAAKKAAKKAK